jgi:hypothetical protein
MNMAPPGEENYPQTVFEGSICMEKHYLTTLAREFRAGEGSFLLQLRVEMSWDKDAFRRLTEAMRACCQDYQHSQEQQERFRKEQEQLTEEQMTDEPFTDEVWWYHLSRQFSTKVKIELNHSRN